MRITSGATGNDVVQVSSLEVFKTSLDKAPSHFVLIAKGLWAGGWTTDLLRSLPTKTILWFLVKTGKGDFITYVVQHLEALVLSYWYQEVPSASQCSHTEVQKNLRPDEMRQGKLYSKICPTYIRVPSSSCPALLHSSSPRAQCLMPIPVHPLPSSEAGGASPGCSCLSQKSQVVVPLVLVCVNRVH